MAWLLLAFGYSLETSLGEALALIEVPHTIGVSGQLLQEGWTGGAPGAGIIVKGTFDCGSFKTPKQAEWPREY